MANIIPPLVSDSPPPPPSEDEEDDEFDDFRESNDISYGCDSFSITSSPEQSPKKIPKEVPSSKQESEFNFDLETPKTIIINSKEIVQMNDGKLGEDEEKDVNALGENVNELSISEQSSSSKHIEEDCNNILLKNNFVNKDLDDNFKENIPSQFILENKNFNQENEICDNSDKISKMKPVVLKDDKKSNELNLSNRHTESTLKLDSSDFSLHTADFVDSHNGGSYLDSELSISIDLKSSNIDNIQNTTLENNASVPTENLQNSEFLNPSVTIHSKNESTIEISNLVKDNIESDLTKNEDYIYNVDSHSSENSSLENDALKIVSSNLNFESKDADFGFFICHPSLEPNFNSLEIETRSETEEDVDDSKDFKNSEFQDIENDFTSFIANNEIILNLPPNNHVQDVSDSDFENFSMNDSKIEELPVENTKSDISNPLQTTTENEEFANFSTFFPTDEENLCKEKDFNKDSSSAFGDFAECSPQAVQSHTLDRMEKDKDNFEDFAAFSVNPEPSDDEFGDFGDFTSSTFDSQNQQSAGTSTHKTNYPLLNQKEAFIKAQEVIKDIFIPAEEDLPDFQNFELAKDDFIFNQIQDITDTPALSYHWSKSTSQKLLLKSLNIDSRNILYSGHSRNTSVPRFAANLGLQPLEPVKMEPLTPTPSNTPTPPIAQSTFQSQTETQEVHNAEFDWTSSGLVNPLDYCQTTLLDLEQLVASLDIPSSSPNYPTLSPTKVQEDWDIWLECAPGGSTIPEDSKTDLQADNFEEFTSFQSSEPSQLSTGWPNVPLRETYISEVTQSHIDVDVYLQPTIVTPEMPRKILSTDEEPAFPETSVDVKDIDSNKDDNVEFDDFQMSAPVSSRETNISSEIEEKEPNKSILEIATDEDYHKNVDEFTKFQNVLEENTRRKSLTYTFNNILMETSSSTSNVLDISNIPKKSSTENYFTDSESVSTNFDTFVNKSIPNTSVAQVISAIDTFEDSSTSKDTEESFTKNVIENSKPHDENSIEKDDDDFTEFHSSAPIQTQMTMPVLEPLKPTLVYSNTPSSQINWPDPGITDVDIRKFEEAFATPIAPKSEGKPKKESHVELIADKTKAPSPQLKKSTTVAPRTEFPMWDTSPVHKVHKKLESKKVEIKPVPTADEDEWSDFVSVAKSSPVHKTKLSDRNQTSSPDLTLSVLNLGSIQPAKQPIPVITAQGLVQTRLSTNTNTVSNHKSNLIIPRQLPQSQPSIISNQFASQAYNVGFNTHPGYNFSSNPPQPYSNQKSSKAGNFVVNGQEDDEWGDFVSSPLPPPHLQNSTTTMGHHSWNQFVPNSGSNAGQFLNQNQFSSGNEMRRSNLVIQKKTSQVPGLVLPDLDFLALKERTGVSKKK